MKVIFIPGQLLFTKSKFLNPIQGGLITSYSGVRAILHTPTNFWTTGDTELKFYIVLNIYNLFPEIAIQMMLFNPIPGGVSEHLHFSTTTRARIVKLGCSMH